MDSNKDELPQLIAIIQNGIKYPYFMDIPKNSAIFKALAKLESNNNAHLIGPHGERSVYQILKKEWEEFSVLPWHPNNWLDLNIATYVMFNFYNFNRNKFITNVNRQPTLIDFYLIWHLGFSFYQDRKFDFLKVPRNYLNRAIEFVQLVYCHEAHN